MADISLSANDIHVLEKIKDPESDPLRRVLVDSSLPRDPHVQNEQVLQKLVEQEREIIWSLREFDVQEEQQGRCGGEMLECEKQGFRNAATRFGDLISEFPNYASARNNRAQALRRLYGDHMLVQASPTPPPPGQPPALLMDPDPLDRRQAATTCLTDLDVCIRLLTPTNDATTTPVSPQAARTLASAHTQRAAIYHSTAKALVLNDGVLDVDQSLHESAWSRLGFEKAASDDFARGGWYGNEIARALAVSVNPTAKLCGEIVREARRREYGDLF